MPIARGGWTQSRVHKKWVCCPIYNTVQNVNHLEDSCKCESMLKSMRKEDPVLYPTHPPLKLLANRENSFLRMTTIFFDSSIIIGFFHCYNIKSTQFISVPASDLATRTF